jgi:tetratricopeptide (TPR) repeat protein
MKDYTSALSSAKKAVELGPDLKEAQYNLAFAELLNGDANHAIEVLKKLLRRISSYPPAEFLLSAALCCKGDNNDRLSSIQNSKQYFFAPSITCSIKELAVDLMAADQVHFSYRLLQTAIDNEIIDDEMMTLYSACLQKINEFRGVGGESCRKDDILKTTVVCN